ncbi:unnamed protein product [Blepharisma stoltei]|uniref:Uncharacterized protein n=1 Tax=Blepharisma stoltei TaxID=1481888 RepID=A0AAU9IFT3_9CILI|nr:unnamed protein product [Blepharisma stoltei]
MNPLIVTYSDFTSSSPFKIMPRKETKKSWTSKRKLPKEKKVVMPIVLYSPKDKFSTRPLCIMDVNPPHPPTPQKNVRPCSAIPKKSPLPAENANSEVRWQFEPLTHHREEWLFRNNKPESHFTPKQVNKKIPLSRELLSLKNHIINPHLETKQDEISKNINKSYEENASAINQENVSVINEYNENNDITDKLDKTDAEIENDKENGKVNEQNGEAENGGKISIKDKKEDVIDQYFQKPDAKVWHESEYRNQFSRINTAEALIKLQRYSTQKKSLD